MAPSGYSSAFVRRPLHQAAQPGRPPGNSHLLCGHSEKQARVGKPNSRKRHSIDHDSVAKAWTPRLDQSAIRMGNIRITLSSRD
ncbi:hypothetical protein HYQ44_004437 [Verticillium longisporum]|nr:hypothetical protein HYQ44_004437 [Verticillium longisporum]